MDDYEQIYVDFLRRSGLTSTPRPVARRAGRSGQRSRPTSQNLTKTQEHQSYLDFLRRDTLKSPPPISLELKDLEAKYSVFTEDWHSEYSRDRDHDSRKLDQAPSVPPDGGAKAWLAVLGAWCCLFCTFGWINCIGIFQTQYQQNELKSYSSSVVAWITSVETCVMYVCMPVNGKLYDAFGPLPLVCGGTLLHVFGLMMASLSTEYYQYMLSQSICSAVGASAIFAAAMGPVGSWFLKKRALAFGIVASGSSLGGCLLPIVVARVGAEVSFDWAMRVCAFIFLFLLMIACLTLRSRIKPTPAPWTPMSFVHPLKEPAFLLNALGLTLFSGGMFIPFNYLILEAEYRGMSEDLANYTISILNAASLFGRILPGWMADHLGKFNVMIITTALSALLSLAMWIPAPNGSNAVTFVFAGLFGFTSGTFVSMTPALVQQLSEVQEIGTRLGVTFGIISIAALTSNPIAGALVQADNGGYLYVKIFAGLAMVVGCGLIVCSRTAQVGWKFVRI